MSDLTASDEKRRDAELVRRALQRDEDAFRELLDIYRGRIFGYVLRTIRNYDDAEDLTLLCFTKAFRALDTFDPSRSLSTWLFTIAHNVTIDFLRKNRTPYEYIDEKHERTISYTPDFSRQHDQDRKLERIENAMAELAPIDREIVHLFYKEQRSYKEICELLDVPVTTIKTRLHRARLKLREIVHGNP
jgi:RNA polymerase sigma-70 factor (ECF subfamily)